MFVFFSPVANEEGAGGDSSKSNSITSDRSVQSVGVSASSQSSSTNSIPVLHDQEDSSNHVSSSISIRPRTRTSIVSEGFHSVVSSTFLTVLSILYRFRYNIQCVQLLLSQVSML